MAVVGFVLAGRGRSRFAYAFSTEVEVSYIDQRLKIET